MERHQERERETARHEDERHLTHALLTELRHLTHVIEQGFYRMSETSDALLQAVTSVAGRVDTLTATIQAEMQDIATALAQAGNGTDPVLEQAARNATDRLNALSSTINDLNTTVQGIIP